MSSGSWPGESRIGQRFAMPRLLPRRLRSLHTLLLVLVLVFLGGLGWLWYRSSPLVKVKHVTVAGLTGPDVPQIRNALTDAALQMTTLHMQINKLEAAVEQYPYVHALTVTREGAHSVLIRVDEQVPVALVKIAGADRVVDADGTLLPTGTVAHGALPTVALSSVPTGTKITQPQARGAIAVLAAAPYALLAHVVDATSSSSHGVIVQLRNGPQLYFGPTTELNSKWDAVVAVLQNSGSDGASYIDVTDPDRPAAGANVSDAQAAELGLASGSSSTP